MAMIAVSLTDVPETMLWTLHNRASEAARPDGVLKDETALCIYRGLDCDYRRLFGKPDASHGVRSAVFDREILAFLEEHPDGVVVNLGEGLETQRFRVDGAAAFWISVDLPEAIAVRERFITPDERHVHVPLSVMDRAWFDAVPRGRPVYITAQGLLMYFEAEDVAALFCDMAARFPGAWFAFDHIPRWLSRRFVRGYRLTKHYTVPPTPWGIDIDDVEPTLRAWVSDLAEVRRLPFRFPRGFIRWVFAAWTVAPFARRHVYGLTRIRFGQSNG